MSTTSRRVSSAGKGSRNSHTPGRDKGVTCKRLKDFGVYVHGNPYKGAGMKGNTAAQRLRLSAIYANYNK